MTTDWQPIATAPKDGTRIDLWLARGCREVDCWWGYYAGDKFNEAGETWMRDAPGWETEIPVIDSKKPNGDAVTHWAPYPSGPTKGQ